MNVSRTKKHVSDFSPCFTSIEIDQWVVIKAPYALTTKSDLELFSPVTSSDEDITIFRGYYCEYQLAERSVRQGIICETPGKHNRAKHFGGHWLFNSDDKFRN